MGKSILIADDYPAVREDSERPGKCPTANCTIFRRPLGEIFKVSQRYRLEVQA